MSVAMTTIILLDLYLSRFAERVCFFAIAPLALFNSLHTFTSGLQINTLRTAGS